METSDEHNEIALPGVWHWIVMIPVTIFAVLLTAGVLWVVIVAPLVAQVSPPPPATARPAQLAITDTATREFRLRTFMEGDAVRQLSWRSAVTDYRLAGDTLTVATTFPPGTDSTIKATDMANRILYEMRVYGDPARTVTVNDSGGKQLIALTYDAIIPPAGK